MKVTLSSIYPLLLVHCLLCSGTWAAELGTQNDVRCPGDYKEGDLVDRGRYWYICQAGQLVPKGCFSNQQVRLNVYESYRSDGYAISCVFDSNGYLGFAYKACVHENREYEPGHTWQDSTNSFWFTCVREGDSLRTEMSGCVNDTIRHRTGDSVEKDGFVHQCRCYANNTCHLTPVGCVHEGRRYRIGDSFEMDQYWYACTIEDNIPMKKCVGCMYEQKRLQDGDRYTTKEAAVFECTIRLGINPDHRLIGCIDIDNGTIFERRIGCRWVRGTAPRQYVMECMNVDDRTVIKKAVHCFYRVGNGGYQVEPGCFKTDGQSLLIGCHKQKDGSIHLETYPIEKLKDAYFMGLKYC